jgi:hypothetical protein
MSSCPNDSSLCAFRSLKELADHIFDTRFGLQGHTYDPQRRQAQSARAGGGPTKAGKTRGPTGAGGQLMPETEGEVGRARRWDFWGVVGREGVLAV